MAELAAAQPGEVFTQAVAPLIAAFEDPTPGLLSSAVLALGAIGQSALLPLISALRAPGAHTREGASRSIGRLRHNAIEPAYLRLAVDPLVVLLNDSHESVRLAAAWTLGRLGPYLETAQRGLPTQFLIRSLKDPSPEVREAAGSALGRMGDGQAIPPLISAMEDHSTAVRKIASESLEALGWQPAESSETALFRVARQDWQHAIATGAAAIPALVHILKSSDRAASISAIQTLGQIPSPDVIDPLVTALKSPDEYIRAAAASAIEAAGAAEALGKIGDSRAVKPLLELLTSDSETTQQTATLALGAIGDVQAIEPLIQLLRSSERQVRTAAASALLDMYRSRKLDVNQKRKILEQKDRIINRHSDSATHQDENKAGDWHSDHSIHEDLGIGLDFPTSMYH